MLIQLSLSGFRSHHVSTILFSSLCSSAESLLKQLEISARETFDSSLSSKRGEEYRAYNTINFWKENPYSILLVWRQVPSLAAQNLMKAPLAFRGSHSSALSGSRSQMVSVRGLWAVCSSGVYYDNLDVRGGTNPEGVGLYGGLDTKSPNW